MIEHDGVLTIDIGAIQRNWKTLQKLASGSKCGAVVKANAYGLGDLPVSRGLYRAGCRSFFVATVNEGLQIRGCLPLDAQIFILGGVRFGREYDCITNNLIPVLFTIEQIQRWGKANHLSQTNAPCALKADSGMTRLGLNKDEFHFLCENKKMLDRCNPILFMSHLACADDHAHPLNHIQLTRFNEMANQLKLYFPSISLSLANSAGIYLGDNWHLDLVRPGSSLYGVNPQPTQNKGLEHVVTLDLPIVQIRQIENESRSVGYGATHMAQQGSRLATVFGGYADGFHRSLSGKVTGLLAGVRVPAVGRLSMDSMVFDISKVPIDAVPPEGRGAIRVLGADLSVDELALAAGTIGYEILTSIGSRFHREYI